MTNVPPRMPRLRCGHTGRARVRVRGVGLACALAAVGSCGRASDGGAEDSPGAAPVDPGDDPSAPGVASSDEAIVIAVEAIPESLDPLADMQPWASRIAFDAVFEGLTRRDPGGAPWAEPALADSCVLRPDDAPREAYCHVPTGRTFHDGSAVEIEDVVYSLDYWLDPRRGSFRQRHGLAALKRVEVVDGPPSDAKASIGPTLGRDPGRWIRVAMSSDDPLLLERLATMLVVPKQAHRGRSTAFGRAPIGTGPRKVTAYESGRLVLAPVEPVQSGPPGQPGQPGQGQGRLIVLREMPDGAEAITELRRGNVHLVAEMASTHVPDELIKPAMAPRFEAWLVTPPRYDLVMYNVRSGVQSGPRLRQALDLALPRAAIAAELGGTPPVGLDAPVDLTAPQPIDLEALARVQRGPRPGMAGLPPALDPAADVQGQAEAAAILDELDWTMQRGQRRRGSTGLRLALMWNEASPQARGVARAVRDAWGELGVRVPSATASWSYLMGPLRRGEFEVGLGRLAERSDADLYEYFHSRGELNVPGVADADLDAALEAYRAASTPQQRVEAKTAIATRLAELQPVSVLHAPTAVLVASRRLLGLTFEDDLPRLTGLDLAPPREWELVRR